MERGRTAEVVTQRDEAREADKGVRRLVLIHGRDDAKRLANPEDRSLVEIAANVLGDDGQRSSFTYFGWAFTGLPHRKIADDAHWELTVGDRRLIVEPGRMSLDGGPSKLVGVPFGARARLIMIYLQSMAVMNRSPEVSLGGSMRAWIAAMGAPAGGETAAALREQARRIATCSLRFQRMATAEKPGTRMVNGRLIKSGLFFAEDARDERQGSLFTDSVVLDQDFYAALIEGGAVPLRDAAVKQLMNSSVGLDLYVWLAFRLRHLSKPTPVPWVSLFQQFGAGYRLMRQWKPKFLSALAEAVAAYPDARVEVTGTGVLLYPSPPPVTRASIQVKLASS